MIVYIMVFLAIFIILIVYLIIRDGLEKIKELEIQKDQIVASQQAKNTIRTVNVKSIAAKPEKHIIYPLNTYPIRYNIYDSNLINKRILKKLYECIIIDSYNFEEPFYSAFFVTLLTLDKNNIFMVAPDSKFIYSNLRDESNNIIRARSYMVLELSEIISMVLIAFGKYMHNNTKKLDQQTILAFCVYALQKADSHEAGDVLQMIENTIGRDGYKNIENITSALQNKEPNVKMIADIFDQAVKGANRRPITDEGILHKCHTINNIEILQKQLQFIQK